MYQHNETKWCSICVKISCLFHMVVNEANLKVKMIYEKIFLSEDIYIIDDFIFT